MKYSLTSKSLRLIALAYLLPIIAVAVAAVAAPGFVAWKFSEAVEYLSNMWLGP